MQGPFTRAFGGSGPFSRGGGGGALAGTGLKVILSFGQSNEVAQTLYTGANDFPEGVLQVAQAGSLAPIPDGFSAGDLIPASHPLHGPPLAGRDSAYHALANFCTAYLAEHPDDQLVIIRSSVGGTSINPASGQWAPGGTVIENAIATVNAFFTAYPGAEVLMVSWMQGESDPSVSYTIWFEAMRSEFIARCPKITHLTPWVVNGLDNETSNAHLAQSEYENVFRLMGFVDTADLDPAPDSLHFPVADLQTIGTRRFAAYQRAIANTEIDLGLGNGFFDFTAASNHLRSVTATAITDGWNFEFVASPSLSSRQSWTMPGDIFRQRTPYRVTFTAECDDVSTPISFGTGTLVTLTTGSVGGANLMASGGLVAANTPVDFTVDLSTAAFTWITTPLIGFVRAGTTGLPAQNLKITNMRIKRTPGAIQGWE